MTTQPSSDNWTPLNTGIRCEPLTIHEVKLTRLTYQPTAGSSVYACAPLVLAKYDVAIIEMFTDQGWWASGRSMSTTRMIIAT